MTGITCILAFSKTGTKATQLNKRFMTKNLKGLEKKKSRGKLEIFYCKRKDFCGGPNGWFFYQAVYFHIQYVSRIGVVQSDLKIQRLNYRGSCFSSPPPLPWVKKGLGGGGGEEENEDVCAQNGHNCVLYVFLHV